MFNGFKKQQPLSPPNKIPCKVDINTIELTVHTSGYCILVLLYVKGLVLRAVFYVELLNVCT